MDSHEPLLALNSVSVQFKVRTRNMRQTIFRALNDVSLTVVSGETTALVGETGSGKSTTIKAIAGIHPIASGQILLNGSSVHYGRSLHSPVQMVFQNPSSSLNPRRRVHWIIEEPLTLAGVKSVAVRRERVRLLMDEVGLDSTLSDRYPGQLSGGQSQRVAIARALAVEPQLLLLDEPLSALDVSVQAQVMGLLVDIQEKSQLGFLFVTHDLTLASTIADQIVVLYLGKVVEKGPVNDVFARPAHPYTQALLSASPDLGKHGHARFILPGEPPNPIDPPSGCPFRTRCPAAQEVCAKDSPSLKVLGSQSSHQVACHFPDIRGSRMDA